MPTTDSPEDQEPLPQDSPSALEALKRLAGRPGVFERYQLEGEIARGGMGAILRVYDQDLRKRLIVDPCLT